MSIIFVIFLIIAWALLGTTSSLFIGDLNSFLIFNKENPELIYIAAGFSFLFIAYKAIHEKNKKKRKFRGTFIRGQK